MREGLKVFASFLFVASFLATIVGLIMLFSDSASQQATNAAIVGANIGITLLSGAMWLLADIAQALRSDSQFSVPQQIH